MKALLIAMILAVAAARQLIFYDKNIKCSQLLQTAGGPTPHGVTEIPLIIGGDHCGMVYLGGGTLYPFYYCYNVGAGMLYNWSSPDLAIDDIIFKGSQSTIIYYPPDGAFSDSVPIHTNLNPNGLPSAISHIDVCWFYRLVLDSQPVVVTQHNVTYQWQIDLTPAPVECIQAKENEVITLSTKFTLSYAISFETFSLEGELTVRNPDPDVGPLVIHTADIASFVIMYGTDVLDTTCGPVIVQPGGGTYTCKFFKSWATPNAPSVATGVSIQIIMSAGSLVKSSPIFIPVVVPFPIIAIFNQCIVVTPTLQADGSLSYDFQEALSSLPALHQYCVSPPVGDVAVISGSFPDQFLVYTVVYDQCGSYKVYLVVTAPGVIGSPAATDFCIGVECPPPPPPPVASSSEGGGQNPQASSESASPPPPFDSRCTRTQGYWQNEKKNWCTTGSSCPYYRAKPWWDNSDPALNSLLSWQGMLLLPVAGPMPSQPASGSCVGYCALAHQYIAAVLNFQSFGGDFSGLGTVIGYIDQAYDIFQHADVRLATWPNVDAMKDLNDKLDLFNNGLMGIRHCD